MWTTSEETKAPEVVKTTEEGQEEEKTTYTKEEVEAMKKDLQSNYEKGFQKKLSQVKEEFTQESDKLVSAIGEVAKDPTNLLTVNESDPKTAKLILDKYYDGMSIESYQIKILGLDPENVKITKPVDAKKLEEEIRAKIQQEQIDAQLSTDYNRFVAENNIAGDDLVKFAEEFKDLAEGKKLTPEKQLKFLKSAMINAEIQPPKKDNTEAVAKAMSTSKQTGAGGTPKKVSSSRVESMREFMKDQGLYK